MRDALQAGVPGVHWALFMRHRGVCSTIHAQQSAVSPEVLPRDLTGLTYMEWYCWLAMQPLTSMRLPQQWVMLCGTG